MKKILPLTNKCWPYMTPTLSRRSESLEQTQISSMLSALWWNLRHDVSNAVFWQKLAEYSSGSLDCDSPSRLPCLT